ncbi:MAG: diguanylate cyclase, partial [Brevibacterium sp.]|nr:diguanylate cyclase [Brevibacterium sp.]
INDSLGHQTGDKLLISLARRLRNSLSSGGSLARFASNEFAVLLDEGDMSPRVGAEAARVVIRGAEELEGPVLRVVVPLLAGDLAGLAADADRGIREEALALVRGTMPVPVRNSVVIDSRRHQSSSSFSLLSTVFVSAASSLRPPESRAPSPRLPC